MTKGCAAADAGEIQRQTGTADSSGHPRAVGHVVNRGGGRR